MALSPLSAYTYPLGNTMNDMSYFSAGMGYGTAIGVVAHAGGTQAAATPLPLASNVWVDTVATNGDSVTLPSAVGGQYITVINNGSANLNVFSSNNSPSDTINGTAGTTAISVVSGKVANFISRPGAWRVLVSA